MSEVYFVPCSAASPLEELERKLAQLWQAAGFAALFTAGQLTAIKLHLGEPGCDTFVSPELVGGVVRQVAAGGAQPFLTDTAVLYRSPRDNAVGHARVAQAHGFTFERTGAPFLPADGLTGADEIEVAVGGKHFEQVAIASGILQASSLLLLSHATGHLGTGLGGALKNLGMGCASRKGKLRQHHGHQPRIKAEACNACGVCVAWCPSGALTLEEVARLDAQACIGCGECLAACRFDAVRFGWGIMGRELQERIVEHAAAVVRRKRDQLACLTVALNITKDCDCIGLPQRPLVADLGLLASRDPVALDLAVLQLIRERAGCSLESLSYPQHDGSIQIRYAAELGLGESQVELITLGS